MLDTQHELDEALSRPVVTDTTDIIDLESELEELLKQPIPPTPATSLPPSKETIQSPVTNETVPPPVQDPFADLELRVQKLNVQDCK